MVELRNVTFGYPLRKAILRDLSLTVGDHDRLWLSAPSGGGKTTLLRLLLGLEQPRRGAVVRPDGLQVSCVFQEDRLLSHLTALQNVALFSTEGEARRVLEELGLGEHLDALPGSLSGGMARRVALARALSHECQLLILDEPFTGLDEETKAAAVRAVDAFCRDKALVIATHEPAEAAALGAKKITL